MVFILFSLTIKRSSFKVILMTGPVLCKNIETQWFFLARLKQLNQFISSRVSIFELVNSVFFEQCHY